MNKEEFAKMLAGEPEQRTPDEIVPLSNVVESEVVDPSKTGDLAVSDMLSQAATNFPASLAKAGADIVQPLLEPVKTAKSLYQLGSGVIQLAVPGEQSNEKYAKAVGRFMADRYGGAENIKKTIAKDPAGFLMDLSMLATGGAFTAAKAAQVAKVGQSAVGKLEAARKAAQLIDPINLGLKGLGHGAGKVASNVSGVFTGVGSKPLEVAYQSGRSGGEKARVFLDWLRHDPPVEELVKSAEDAVAAIASDRRASYLKQMEKTGKNLKILSFDPIIETIVKYKDEGKFGDIQIRDSKAADTLEEVLEAVNEFQKAAAENPQKYATALGFDALKRKIGIIRDSFNPADKTQQPSYNIANQVYSTVRKQITDNDKDYHRAMKDYESMSDLITDIQKTFSLTGKRSSVDTKVRKLTSLMRNNVNTAYGRREQLAQKLVEASPNNPLLEQIAGAALNPWAPRGLARITGAAGLTGGFMLGNVPGALTAAAASSPRLAGEVSYGLGRLSRGNVGSKIRRGLPYSFQVGRTAEEVEKVKKDALARALAQQ
jgi:hypothetical protein